MEDKRPLSINLRISSETLPEDGLSGCKPGWLPSFVPLVTTADEAGLAGEADLQEKETSAVIEKRKESKMVLRKKLKIPIILCPQGNKHKN
jgi:hypothetical protein